MISISSNIDRMLNEIKRLTDPMGSNLPDRFESIVVTQFQLTQRAVHIQTGSLKSSGKLDTDTDDNSWKGTISYGGISSGVHNPVRYAGHELERGGPHNYMAEAINYGNLYGPAIIGWMRGE